MMSLISEVSRQMGGRGVGFSLVLREKDANKAATLNLDLTACS
jgi:hypothetical protein